MKYILIGSLIIILLVLLAMGLVESIDSDNDPF